MSSILQRVLGSTRTKARTSLANANVRSSRSYVLLVAGCGSTRRPPFRSFCLYSALFEFVSYFGFRISDLLLLLDPLLLARPLALAVGGFADGVLVGLGQVAPPGVRLGLLDDAQ